MGAVNFSIDPELIKTLQNNLTLDIFVETGTFKGAAVETVKNYFKQIYSIELSREYYEQAVQRFEHDLHIKILHGSSAQLITKIIPKITNRPVVFWLDAHWCVANATAGELSQCPLLEELSSIGHLHSDSVVIIDDARLFLAAPPTPHEVMHWPSFNTILSALQELSQSHNIMVVNDCILFYPQKIEKAMQLFAHQHGINWLEVLDKSRDYDKLLKQLIEKEAEIKLLKEACDLRDHTLMTIAQTEKSISKEHYDILLHRIKEHERTILALKKGNNANNMDFVTDINAHFAEIYSRLSDLHEQSMLLHKNSSIALNEKYIRMRDEKLKLLDPLRKNRIFELDNRSWLQKLEHRLELFFTPKLGELNIYPARTYKTPQRYKKIRTQENAPTISIVTPSFNHGAFIERTIKSVLEQGYPKLEYIIQDGQSNDQTIEIIQRYQADLKFWESFRDSGQSNAINLGFRHATGEIMAYLNSDDILLPGALHFIAHYFATHPDVDVVYGHRILIDENDLEIGRWVLPPHDSEILSWADYVPQETLFWRRKIWDQVGGKIDENFKFAMDWDLILRFRDAGAKFARLPRFLGAFRIHPHQKTSAEISLTGIEEMQKLRERCHGRRVCFTEIANATRSYLNRHLIYHKFYRAGLLRY